MKKLLVWDGDNTLWPGVLAEGDKVVISPERLALLEEIANHGILQSLATFNHPKDVEDVVYRHGLDRWFLHNQASMGPETKADMIHTIKEAYDLSRYEDIAFVDDETFNRAEVTSVFNGAVVAVRPENLSWLLTQHFTKDQYTDEDRTRVRRYQSEQQRKVAAQAFGTDRQAFLRSCGLKLTIRRAEYSDIPRINDLFLRANRMAALISTYCRESLTAMLIRKRDDVWIGQVEDKFGNYGLSSVAIVNDRNVIDALVVSCRLRGRGIGSALLGWLINHPDYQPTQARSGIIANWYETEYNSDMRNLYEWYKFQIKETNLTGGKFLIAYNGPESAVLPDWVEVIS